MDLKKDYLPTFNTPRLLPRTIDLLESHSRSSLGLFPPTVLTGKYMGNGGHSIHVVTQQQWLCQDSHILCYFCLRDLASYPEDDSCLIVV